MDKYEYQLKTEHIKQVAARKEFEEAAKLCDTIDWTKIRDVKMLTLVADIYTAIGEYEDAIDILQQAYQYAAMGRRILYRLTELALKADSYEDAKNYFEEFCRIAPNDQGRYILLYKMARSQKATIEEKITILEAYKREDFDEKWAYELAVLYAMNEQKKKCVQLCDDIILWFGLGKYVEKALNLKSQFAPLTPAQKEKAQKFADKKAKDEHDNEEKAQLKEHENVNSEQQEVYAKKNEQPKQDEEKGSEKINQKKNEAKTEGSNSSNDSDKNNDIKGLEEKSQEKDSQTENITEKNSPEKNTVLAEIALDEQKEAQKDLQAEARRIKEEKREHAMRSVVTSDMKEIMAIIQRARQEDAGIISVDAEDKESSNVPKLENPSKHGDSQTIENIEGSSEKENALDKDEPLEKKDSQESEPKQRESADRSDEEDWDVYDPIDKDFLVYFDTENEEDSEPLHWAEPKEADAEIRTEYENLGWQASDDESEEMSTDSKNSIDSKDSLDSTEEEYEDSEEYTEEEYEESYEESEEYTEEEYEESYEEPEEYTEEEYEESYEESEEYTEDSYEDSSAEPEVEEDVQEEEYIEYEYDEYEEEYESEEVQLPVVNPEDLTRVWHFAIQALPGEDDIELALGYLQELAESSPRAVPQSVVKITGEKLNQKGLIQSIDKLLGKTILIENAGDMNERVINEFCKIIDPTDRSLLVVFIDTPVSIKRLLTAYPQLNQAVTAQFVKESYSVGELLEYAKLYADRQDSTLEESGELALMERLKVIADNKERDKKRIVEVIINNAIQKAERKSIRGLFKAKYDKKGCLILRDRDFEVG